MESASPRPPALYAAFILLALFTTLAIGSLSGAIFVMHLRQGGGLVLPFQKEAHARLQLFGFVLTLIMGIAFHALPRFLGVELRATARIKTALAAMVLAVTAWTATLFLHRPSEVLQILGGAGALAATAMFAHVLLELLETARSHELYPSFIRAGAWGWLAAALLNVTAAFTPAVSSDAVYAAAFFGGILPWTFGMSLRTAFTFMGLEPPNRRLLGVSLRALLGGATLNVMGLLLAAPRFEALGLLVVALAALLFIAGAKVFRRSAVHVASPGFPFALWMRAAHGFLALFAALCLSWGVVWLATGVAERAYLLDGLRHALATGYLLLLIMGMMGKVLPLFSGRALRARGAFLLGGCLLTLGTLAREAQVVSYFVTDPILSRLSAHSGPCTYAGLLLSATAVLITLARRPQSV